MLYEISLDHLLNSHAYMFKTQRILSLNISNWNIGYNIQVFNICVQGLLGYLTMIYSAIHKAAVRPAAVQNVVWRVFQLPAPFMAYGGFRNYTRQNHGMAGNHEAGGFVNSAVNE